MDELSQDQKAQLSSWASQRDILLADIANLKDEKQKLVIGNNQLAESNTDIVDRINQNIGRLTELDKKEEEYEKIVSAEIANLLPKKTELQAEISNLKKEVDFYISQKDSLLDLIMKLTSIHNKLSENALHTEKMIGHVTEVNSSNVREVESLLITIKNEVKKIIDLNAENVDKTNKVITELPRIIFDLQRDILERKHFNKIQHDILS